MLYLRISRSSQLAPKLSQPRKHCKLLPSGRSTSAYLPCSCATDAESTRKLTASLDLSLSTKFATRLREAVPPPRNARSRSRNSDSSVYRSHSLPFRGPILSLSVLREATRRTLVRLAERSLPRTPRRRMVKIDVSA